VFLILLLVVLLAATVHAWRTPDGSRAHLGELYLRWLLAGYCGIPMVVIAVGLLAAPDRAADILGFPAGNAFEAFLGVAYLGMAVAATLAAWFRGAYLVGPAAAWVIFWFGATFVHVADFMAAARSGGGGHLSHAVVLHVFATHALVGVLLLAALLVSGAWKARA